MIKLQFQEGENLQKFETAIEEEMQKNIDHFEQELRKIRTGRAHPSLIEDVMVPCYGSTMSLKSLASVSAPEAQQLTIQPWDKTTLPDIERAIAQSELQLSPVTNGNIIRINLPPMSQERRNELVKKLHKKLEEARVQIRNTRKNFHNFIRDTEKAKNISEDTAKRLQDVLEKMTVVFIHKAQKISDKKEEDIKAV